MNACLKTFTLQVNNPGPCPPGGTPTPCQITQNVSTNFGNLIVPVLAGNPDYVAKTVNWGASFGGGLYTVTYVNGAYKSIEHFGSPVFGFAVNTQTVFAGGSTPDGGRQINGNEFAIPFKFAGYDGATQAAAEASFAASFTGVTFSHTSGPIGLVYASRNINLGGDYGENFTPGAPNPTFKLTQSQAFQAMPPNIRVHSYNESLFDTCPGNSTSINPPWNGTLGQDVGSFVYSPTLPGEIYLWDSEPNTTINGQDLIVAELLYVSDGSLPTATGCGWDLQLYLSADVLWHGVKGVGTDPIGCYDRIDGCSPGPLSLTIESYTP